MKESQKIYYVMGVSGSGKSTVGIALAEQLCIPYLEADDFHPESNIKKMASGLPLNDIDRAPWLASIRSAALQASKNNGAVISCSALKQIYRTQLEKGLSKSVIWVYLDGSFDLIWGRMKKRPGHFMPPSLLQSQFDILEPPHHAIRVDISLSTEEMLLSIMSQIKSFQ